MPYSFVGQHSFLPTDRETQIGAFDLGQGHDCLWVRVTQINAPDSWPWSYGILSWRNSEGLPLGSVKAYSTRLGEVFRLSTGLPPLDRNGSIWFEPRGFNLGWLKAGFPWELAFEAQSGVTAGATVGVGGTISFRLTDGIDTVPFALSASGLAQPVYP